MRNFKKLYKADNRLLSPEKELLEFISERMKAETERRNALHLPLLNRIPIYKTATAAAVFLIITASFILLPLALNGGIFVNDNLKSEKGEYLTAETNGLFSPETYSANEDNAEEQHDNVYFINEPEIGGNETPNASDAADNTDVTDSTFILNENHEFDESGEQSVSEPELQSEVNPDARSAFSEPFEGIASDSDAFDDLSADESTVYVMQISEAQTEATTQSTKPPAEEQSVAELQIEEDRNEEPQTAEEPAAGIISEEKKAELPISGAVSAEEDAADNPGTNISTGLIYGQLSGFGVWPPPEYWKSYAVSAIAPSFINSFDKKASESGAGADTGNIIEENEQDEAIEYEYDEEYYEEEDSETEDDEAEEEEEEEDTEVANDSENYPPSDNSAFLPPVPVFNLFGDFSKMFLSAPHKAVSVRYSTEANGFYTKDLNNKNTLPFFSLLSSCLDRKMNRSEASDGYYVIFTVKTESREIYFKITSYDFIEISLSDFSGIYRVETDKGTFNRIWNLAYSY